MMVVVHHFLMQLSRHGSGEININSHLGAAGVDIFFVISGFIMVYITNKRNFSSLEFIRDRLIRIVPLYWLYTFVMIFLAIFLPSLLNTATFDLSHSISSLLFIPDYHPKSESDIWPILFQGWTLNYEMFFYFVFALVLMLDQRIRASVLTTTLIVLPLLGVAITIENELWITYTNLLLLEFLAGTILGYLYIQNKLPGLYFSLLVFFAGLALLIAQETGTVSLHNAFGWGIPSFGIVMLALVLESNYNIVKIRLFRMIGDSSYSLYLVHTFVLYVIGFVWSKISYSSLFFDLVVFVVSIISCTIAGIISYRLFEVPATKFLKQKFS